MTDPHNGGPRPDRYKKEIFLALVEAQDQKLAVADSRSVVAARFGVTAAEVARIEKEGLEGNWPPL